MRNLRKLLLSVVLVLCLLSIVGLLRESGFVRSAAASMYYGPCYYCQWNGSTYDCKIYDGPGGEFCYNSGTLNCQPSTHFPCRPSN